MANQEQEILIDNIPMSVTTNILSSAFSNFKHTGTGEPRAQQIWQSLERFYSILMIVTTLVPVPDIDKWWYKIIKNVCYMSNVQKLLQPISHSIAYNS